MCCVTRNVGAGNALILIHFAVTNIRATMGQEMDNFQNGNLRCLALFLHPQRETEYDVRAESEFCECDEVD